MVANRWSPHKFWLDLFPGNLVGWDCTSGRWGLLCKQIFTLFPTENYQISKGWSMMVDFQSPESPANLAGAEGSGRWMYNSLTGGSCTARTVSHVIYMCLHIYKTWFSMDLVCERYDMLNLIHVDSLRHCHTRHTIKVWLCWRCTLVTLWGCFHPRWLHGCSGIWIWQGVWGRPWPALFGCPDIQKVSIVNDPFKSGTWHPGVDYHTSICMAFGEKVELSAYLTCKGVALWWKKLPVFPNGFVSWVDSCNVFCFRVIHVEVLGLKVCHKSVNDQTCFHTLVVSLCFFSTYHCQLRDPHGSSAVLQDVCVLSSKKGFIKYCLQQLGRLKCHHMSWFDFSIY